MQTALATTSVVLTDAAIRANSQVGLQQGFCNGVQFAYWTIRRQNNSLPVKSRQEIVTKHGITTLYFYTKPNPNHNHNPIEYCFCTNSVLYAK